MTVNSKSDDGRGHHGERACNLQNEVMALRSHLDTLVAALGKIAAFADVLPGKRDDSAVQIARAALAKVQP